MRSSKLEFSYDGRVRKLMVMMVLRVLGDGAGRYAQRCPKEL